MPVPVAPTLEGMVIGDTGGRNNIELTVVAGYLVRTVTASNDLQPVDHMLAVLLYNYNYLSTTASI